MEPKLLLAWNPRPGELMTSAEAPEAIRIQDFESLSFFASIASTNQRQSATTLDNTYTIQFKTHDFNIMELGKIRPLTLVRVTVEIADAPDRWQPDEERDKYYE